MNIHETKNVTQALVNALHSKSYFTEDQKAALLLIKEKLNMSEQEVITTLLMYADSNEKGSIAHFIQQWAKHYGIEL